MRERLARVPVPELNGAPPRRCEPLQSRDHLYGLFGQRRHRPHPAVRRDPPDHFGRGMASTSNAASSSASPRSTCCSTTSTTASTSCATASFPRELILGNRNYRPAMRGVDGPHKAYVNICGTDIVRDAARRLPGSRGQCPDAFRGKLCDRKPAYDAARLSRPDGRDRLRPIDNYGPRLVAAMRRNRAGGRRRPTGRAAVPGHLQLGLFRTCVSGARDGGAAGRGARPPGGGRSGLHAHDARPARGST